MSQSLNFTGTGRLVALFSHQKRLSQDAFSEREQLVDVLGSDESFLDGNRDHLLTQTRSELMKQEQSFSMLNDWNWRTPITDTLNLDKKNKL